MTCVKTGCALVRVGEPGYYWGDMHSVSAGTLIFNAVLNRRGEAQLELFEEDEPRHMHPTYFLWDDYGGHFERRGVFVIRTDALGWNELIQRHLGLPEGYYGRGSA